MSLKITPKIKEPKEKIIEKLSNLILSAVKSNVPKGKFGILFSGGIDSVVLLHICSQIKAKFNLYIAVIKGVGEPADLKWAKRIASDYKAKLRIREVKFSRVEKYLEKIVPLVGTSVVDAGIALTIFPAAELAGRDEIKVLLSGMGAEDIFAGYEKYKSVKDINKQCLARTKNLLEKELPRDRKIAKANNLEIRTPLLEKEIIKYSLRIPAKYKIVGKLKKAILREAAMKLGIKKEYALRPKKAAQYGSNADKAIMKLAKLKRFKSKSSYLNSFFKLGVLYSSGKDSNYSLYLMKQKGYDIACLITIKSKNPESYMYHTPNVEMTKLQSQALKIPLIIKSSKGEKEKELADLRKALQTAKKKYKIAGIVSGALYSNYQRTRIERICKELGLEAFSPLWHMDQEQELREIVKLGFEAIIVSVSAEGLDQFWLGKVIDNEKISELVKLNKKYGINIAFEGGEAETLVLDCPFFSKKIKILKAEKEWEKNAGTYKILKAKLVRK